MINVNGKQSAVIGAAAAATGAVIYGVSLLVRLAGNRKSKKDPEAEAEEKAEPETEEDSE